MIQTHYKDSEDHEKPLWPLRVNQKVSRERRPAKPVRTAFRTKSSLVRGKATSAIEQDEERQHIQFPNCTCLSYLSDL